MNHQGGHSRICLCLTGETIQENLETYRRYARSSDMAEIRADFLLPEELRRLDRAPSLLPVPLILTIRRRSDGGVYDGAESHRLELIRRAVAGGFAFVDLEEDLEQPRLEREARARGTRIIRSFHESSGPGRGMEARIRALKRHPTDLPKAAVRVDGTAELCSLVEIYRRLEGWEKILVGMGPASLPLRILACSLGSYLTFSSAAKQRAAEGHTDPETLDAVYRVRALSRSTHLFAIAGNPVLHSRSPGIHNTGFASLGMDAVYFPVQADSIEGFLRLAGVLGIRGASVTLPFKQAVIPHLTSSEVDVSLTGACNTLVRSRGGWHGANTDVSGFMEPLAAASADADLSRLRATVIGAGGAARSAVYALRRSGCQVLVLNRTPARAEELAAELGCRWAALDRRGLAAMSESSDIVVQTTSVGMSPDDRSDPVEDYAFQGHEIAYDIVYTPPMTRFLLRAKRAGCRIIQGGDMLLCQALQQFRLFTGREFPEADRARLRAELVSSAGDATAGDATAGDATIL